ncbi:siderophore-interacting protein [Patulibacter sp.]|uniref:siderophore-interacting protein n=1 Tax=Patulibacter sp. TaxID=1912859 RepID=UPI002716BAB4|nr:siderophore-interacting protein [Patulibacter sp.]MDO9410366.1 siderophore-interacting protein [Patulibacter sp.]
MAVSLSPAALRAKERPSPLTTGHATVLRARRLTPGVQRIVFSGADLARLPDEEPGEIITLIWPADDAERPVLPTEGWRYAPGTPDQHWRNYTVRDYVPDGPDGPLLTVDFVLHGDHGRCSRWATHARPGMVLGFAGPRIHFYAESDADWTLLVGDETGLPSIAATLERLPAGHPTLVFVEIADAAERQELSSEADLVLEWVTRDGESAGRSRCLEEAVRAASLPQGTPKVWVAGESLAVRGIREHLKHDRGLPIGPSQAIGYWKHRLTPDDVE